MARTVLYIDIPEFPMAVEQVLEPRLRDRPAAVAAETASRARIYSVSAEARRQGIRRGMDLMDARKRCADLVVLPPHDDLYRRASQSLVRRLYQYTPVIEPRYYGHAYLECRDLHQRRERFTDLALRAQREIRSHLNLKANVGVASNKLVSKVASDVVTLRGQALAVESVRHGEEAAFLAPLTVALLPGVRGAIRTQLFALNIRRIGDVNRVSEEQLQKVFGRFGRLLHQRSVGIDPRPVCAPRRSPEWVETDTLEPDSNAIDHLQRITCALLYRGTRKLRQTRMMTQRITVDIRYADAKTDHAQRRCRATRDEPLLLSLTADTLEAALSRRVRVRQITLRFSDLIPESQQLVLFDLNAPSRYTALTQAMDRIRDRYGHDSIWFGRAA